MERLYFNSEKDIWRNKALNDFTFRQARNSGRWKDYDLMRYNDIQYYVMPQDILMAKYKWNGESGKLRYTKDMSKKTDFLLLDKYGNELEIGRDVRLWNSVNKDKVKVSSYDIVNRGVGRVEKGATEKLLIK